MEKKPKNWQRRGVFALVSQREKRDALAGYDEETEDEDNIEE